MTQRSVLAFLLLAAWAIPAQAQELEQFEGYWVRPPLADEEGKPARVVYFRRTEDGLEGTIVNPPFDFEGVACKISLKLEDGNRLVGTAHWSDQDWAEDLAWEFTVASPDLLEGRSQWVDWEQGRVYERGWDDHRLVRAAEADVTPMGGVWRNVDGTAWTATVTDGRVTIQPVTSDAEPIDLAEEGGVLKGSGSAGEVLELVFDPTTDTLAGVQRDGDQLALLSFSRVSAAAEEPVVEEPVVEQPVVEQPVVEQPEGSFTEADQIPLPSISEGVLTGLWKRTDGLFLRVVEQAGETVGDLVDRDGTVQARLRFELADGIWIATVNWGDVETEWQLAISEDELKARTEWADLDTNGNVTARGWTPQSFARLTRVDAGATSGEFELGGTFVPPATAPRQPASEEPVVEEPVVEEPVVEEPVVEEPVVEEPVVEEPVVEEPVVEEPVVEEPVVEEPVVEEPVVAQPEVELPSESHGPLVGVWKREDGLFLRVQEIDGMLIGDLVERNGEHVARLVFTLREDGLWSGTANWGDLETAWVVAVQDDELVAKSEWVDVDEAGVELDRGWTRYAFARLQKAF